MKVVIIGGVAGGATAAARIRRLDEKAEIIIFERTGYISYANCGLPYYVGNVITDGEELTLQTPQSFKSRFNVDVRVLHEVTAIYPDKHEVDVKNLQTGETFTKNYDKLLFERGSCRILGGQIAGYGGVDKRIDVLATAMCGGITAVQLKDLDLAYAPPYSSAKDPINVAGYVADNVVNGVIKQAYIEDISSLQRDSVTLLDTRTPGEYANGHIDGFINIPVDDLRDRIKELDKAKPVYIICQSGLRSYVACRILAGYGYDCYNIAGGYGYYSTVVNGKCLTERATPCGMDI